jgi:predicted transport protein/uncharacterized protein with ParB-like and HNH nuclease domain
LVYVYASEPAIGEVTPAQVIDGQQRLTTITILLSAIFRHVGSIEGRADEATRLRSRYIFNAAEVGDSRYKLVLTRSDRDTLMRLLDGNPATDDASERILAADRYFSDRLAQEEAECDAVLKGLHHLMAVSVALNRSNDNPQLVFDSLNSTGLDLAEGDRIRNLVLMDLAPGEQEQIYAASWYPMEDLFRGQEAATFDRFVRDYLTTMTKQIARIDRIYDAFKKYAALYPGTRSDLVAEMFRARLWGRVALGRESNPAIKAVLDDIGQLKVDVTYPFLLALLADYDALRIDQGELIELLRMVETYVFRRAVCAIPANTLTRTFAGLRSEIVEERYVESAFAAFLLKESYLRVPTDEEFETQLCIRDMYSFRLRNYLLSKLENFKRKEFVAVTDYTIEHVMPQNPDLSPEWQEALGPEWVSLQKMYLHTLGNLTLTGYNSELSDRSFAEKQTMVGGFRDSPIRLNDSIARSRTWDEAVITARARELAQQCLRVWPLPSLNEAVLAGYRRERTPTTSLYRIEDHEALTGPLRELFDDLDLQIKNLDSGITRDVRKLHVAYKFMGSFASVVPRKSDLLVYLAADATDLSDPGSHVRDVRGVGHWGTGNSEIVVGSTADFDWALPLLQQVLDRQLEGGTSAVIESEEAVERVLELADSEMRTAARELLQIALSHGLYPRPWKRALMFTPPSNHLWCLLTIFFNEAETRLVGGFDAFAKFYSMPPDEVSERLNLPRATSIHVDSTRVRATALALDALMTSIAAKSESGLPS